MRARSLFVGVLVALVCVPVMRAGAEPAPGMWPSWCLKRPGGYRCMVGPIDVGAGESVEFLTGVAAPSEAGYITSGQATLVDGEGHPIAHHMVHLHHAVWLNPEKRDMTCNEYDGFLPNYDRFFATGKERTKLVMPDGYGYYWSNQASQPYTQSAPWWGLVAHLDGMHGSSQTYIQLDIGFVPATKAKGMVDVRPVWLDVRNCSSDPVFTVDKGSGQGGVFKETWSYKMPRGGRFVFVGGHLHDGGLRISLRNETAGRNLFTSVASYGLRDEPWFLTKMSKFTGAPGKPVDKGDRLRLTAVYDSTHTWRDVMGIMVGVLAPR